LTNKKFRIIFPPSPLASRTTTKEFHIDFGDLRYKDFIIYNLDFGKSVADIHRERYLSRHAPQEDWSNPYTAGFWSRFLLWEKRNLKSAIKNIEKMLGVKIKSS
jgi:hypothetical protein